MSSSAFHSKLNFFSVVLRLFFFAEKVDWLVSAPMYLIRVRAAWVSSPFAGRFSPAREPLLETGAGLVACPVVPLVPFRDDAEGPEGGMVSPIRIDLGPVGILDCSRPLAVFGGTRSLLLRPSVDDG